MFKTLTRSFLLTALLAIPTMAQETSTSRTLSEQLAEKAAGFAKQAPADRLATFAKGIADVRESGIENSAKQVGEDAVDGTLKGWKGDSVTLSKLWSEGPVVLMWYRGGWCPYCNIQLRAMQQSLDKIENAGAKLVVLTPELPEKAKETAEASGISIVALHDKDLALAKQYGTVFELPDAIAPMYKSRLPQYNGNNAMELPLSAPYVINSSGKITYAFLDAYYKKRAEPGEVIAAVQAAAK